MIAKIIVGDYHFNGRSWTGTSPVAIEFVQHLMQVDPDTRPYATEVLKHPFLQTIERSGSGAESGYSAADTRMADVGSYAGSYISSASSHKLGRFAPQCDSEFQFGSMRSVTSLVSSPMGKQAAGSGGGHVLSSLCLCLCLSLSLSLSHTHTQTHTLSSSRTYTHTHRYAQTCIRTCMHASACAREDKLWLAHARTPTCANTLRL
jgi:serine/threonine protein kinase